MNAYEYRVIVKSTDERPEAPERIEAEIMRNLGHVYGAQVYVEIEEVREQRVKLTGEEWDEILGITP